MKSVFPTYGSRDLGRFYLLTVLQNTWFIAPNWVFYFARFITLPKIGVIDSISKVVSLIIEVPSGALADRFGRKKSLIFGHAALALCCILIILAKDFTALLLGNCVMFFGFSLLSGAKEALLYDNMKAEKLDQHYEHVLGRISFLVTVSSVVSIFMGGLLYSIAPEATFWAWGICNISAILLLSGLKEHSLTSSSIDDAPDSYWTKLHDGISSLFRRKILVYTIVVLYLAMLIKSYEGVIRQATSMQFGLTGETFGYLFALVSIPSAIASYNFGRLYARLKFRMLIPIFISYFVGFIIIFLFRSIPAFLVSFVLIYTAQEFAKPLITTTVNRHTQSKHRATTLSVVALISEIPYIIITGLFGFIFAPDNINKFYLVQSLILCAVSVVIITAYRKKTD